MFIFQENAVPAWARRFLLLGWVLALVCVSVLALLPTEYLHATVFGWWDKAQHALAFAVLTTWALLLWPGAAVRIGLGMLVFGALIECAQWVSGWRFGEWADWGADAVGIVVAVVCVQWILGLRSFLGGKAPGDEHPR
jgi:VanZ family protein